MNTPSRQRSMLWIAAAAAALLLASGTVLVRHDAFWITDGGNKFMVLRNFLEHGTTAMVNPAAALDPDGRFFPTGGFHFQRYGGRIYSVFPPVWPVLSAAWFRWFGPAGLYLPPLAGAVLATVAAAWFFRRCRLPETWRGGLTAGFAFVTPLAFYAWTFWEMTCGVLPPLAAVLLLTGRRRPAAGALWAGAVLGAGLWLRSEMYFFVAAAFVTLLTMRRRREALALAAGFAVGGLPIWIWQWGMFGHVLGLHGAGYHRHNLSLEGMERWRRQLLNYAYYWWWFRPGGNAWVAAALPLLLLISALVGWRRRYRDWRRRKMVLMLAGVLIWAVAVGALWRGPEPVFSTLFTVGVWASLPFLLPVVLNWRPLWLEPDRTVRFGVRLGLIYTLLLPPLLTSTDYGIIWGARHWLPVMPLLLAAAAAAAWRMRAGRLWVLLLLVSVGVQSGGWRALAVMKANSAELTGRLAGECRETVVSDVYFLPMQTPRLFFERQWLWADRDEAVPELLDLLRRGRVERFSLVVSASPDYRRLSNRALAQLLEFAEIVRPPAMIRLPGTSFLNVNVFDFKRREAPAADAAEGKR